jgi:hypothetical protein
MFAVMRPDGTKADMFYKPAPGAGLISNPCESEDGRVVFIETTGGKGKAVSISYNRPLHSFIDLGSGIEGDFYYLLPAGKGKYLASFRGPASSQYSLYQFDPQGKIIGKEILSDPGYNILDVAIAEKYNRPKKLPSEVDMAVKTGLLLCQDINFLNKDYEEGKTKSLKAEKIEVLGLDTLYGVVSVEEDGSFYLKVMADKPFRIRTLDSNGRVVYGPCNWMWLRPNERRGCIGCHEDPELVPDNKVSLAIRKQPVIIPVHITDIKEKTVELE